MIWTLGIAGILLALLGVWGGPAQARHREPEAPVRKPAAGNAPADSDAWEILSKPLQDELIKIPEHRPWYAPGSDRRFLQGLAVGLGAGLIVASAVISTLPRQAPAPQVAANEGGGAPAPADTARTAPGQAPGQAPAAQTPAAQPAPAAKPANISFVVDEGDSAPVIADKLKSAGLIDDSDKFLARVTERGVDTLLKAGTFVVPTGAPLDAVIDALTA